MIDLTKGAKIKGPDPEQIISQLGAVSQKLTSRLVSEGIRISRELTEILRGGSGCAECNSESPGTSRSDVANYICPPPDLCAPRCMMTLVRHSHPGEVIIVHFGIRNTGSYPKTYQVGIRPFVDPDGNGAPINATLNKTKIQVMPGKYVVCEMRLEIPRNLSAGSMYQTDIVIRENKHNQNICFTLYLDGYDKVPVAAPLDEKGMDTHFHRWSHHFYCTPKTRFGNAAGAAPLSENITVYPDSITKGKK